MAMVSVADAMASSADQERVRIVHPRRGTTVLWHVDVLVVDDDAADRSLIVGALREVDGVGVIRECGDPRTALFDLAERKITADLILLDIHMPRVNGFTFVDALRKIPAYATVPVVFLTTSQHSGDVHRARTTKINGYIVKPDVFEELVERVASTVRITQSGGWQK